MRLRRGLTASTFAGLALVVGVASFAWACSLAPDPYLYPLSPNSGPSGTDVRVSGAQWKEGRIEIRLGDDGPLLAETTVKGGSFSATVRIHAPAGTFQDVMAVQDGTTKVMPFQVTGATSSAGRQGDSSTDDSSGGSASGATTANSSRDGSTAGSTDKGSTTAGTGGVARRPSGAGGIPEERPAEPVPAEAAVPAASGAASASGSRGAAVPGNAPAPVAAPGPAQAPAASDRGPGGSSASLRRTVDGMNSGFAVDGRAPGLIDNGPTPVRSSSYPMGMLAGLFGVGLVALFGGFAAASLRRRPVPSSPND